jgi:small subunit ribosomal protein S17
MASATVAGKKTEEAAEAGERGTRRVEVGIVLSDKRQKTITVEIKHLVKHPRYGKYMYRSTHLHAHDEKNEAKKGDRVEIIETRPLSKQKRWRLIKVLERAAVLGALDVKEVEVPAAKSDKPKAPTTEAKPDTKA